MTEVGGRGESHDLRVNQTRSRTVRPGRYEVKSLWQRKAGLSFDRRIRLGQRGEDIYGRRDSAIKAFALTVEENVDAFISTYMAESAGSPMAANTFDCTGFVTNVHGFIDDALTRRHSKNFEKRLDVMLKLADRVGLTESSVRSTVITGPDICRGFMDIEGIFIVAGHMYTLVTKDEMGDLLTFDSASSEGPKLRLVTAIPSQ